LIFPRIISRAIGARESQRIERLSKRFPICFDEFRVAIADQPKVEAWYLGLLKYLIPDQLKKEQALIKDNIVPLIACL
jgi:hypothetical protein